MRMYSYGVSNLEALAEIFKVLGDPTRLRLLTVIQDHERCVHEITALLGLEQSTVSHQLKKLRDKDLVRVRREGRHVYYTLADAHVRQLLEVGLAHAEHDRRSP